MCRLVHYVFRVYGNDEKPGPDTKVSGSDGWGSDSIVDSIADSTAGFTEVSSRDWDTEGPRTSLTAPSDATPTATDAGADAGAVSGADSGVGSDADSAGSSSWTSGASKDARLPVMTDPPHGSPEAGYEETNVGDSSKPSSLGASFLRYRLYAKAAMARSSPRTTVAMMIWVVRWCMFVVLELEKIFRQICFSSLEQ